MSKGLGKVEQQLLHEIEINPQERTVVALFNMDATEAEARRRAARSLDRKGLAVLRKTGRKGKFRSKSLLLSAKAAEEWDARVAREDAEKASDKRREAAREELKARRAIQANEGKNGRDASAAIRLRRVFSSARSRLPWGTGGTWMCWANTMARPRSASFLTKSSLPRPPYIR